MRIKTRNALLAVCAAALCSAAGLGEHAVPVEASASTGVIVDCGFEENAEGYVGSGATVGRSEEQAYTGTASLKVSNRSEVWNAYSYDVSGVELDVWYEYSFYAYTTAEGNGIDVQATYSPWGRSSSGNLIWVYEAGDRGCISMPKPGRRSLVFSNCK